MVNTLPKSRPSLMVRPTTIKPAVQQQQQQQPQIIVIPQSMLSGNRIFSIGSDTLTKPTLTRVIKPTAPSSMEANRTIYLKRPLPQSSPHFDTSCSGSDDDMKMESDENGMRARKRANLDHMSQEEKMMRRKLKNRVAAQNARDKKRVKMEDMEVTVRQLQQQNKKLARQNEELLALNRRLMAENESLKSNQTTMQNATVLIKEEFDVPYTPESLHPPQSHTPPLSSDEDDEVMMSPALPLEAVDTSSIPVSNAGALAAIAGRRSSVSHRLLVPAEPTNVLQQQGQSRSQAEEWATSKSTAASAPEQLACLLWMCLLNPSKASQTTSQSEEAVQQSTEQTNSEKSSSTSKNSLPPKKRGNWWGSHQPYPHAKT